ncbi:MAG: hypothetical protein Q9191_005460 [Dirinaria sp. TL-2023a]
MNIPWPQRDFTGSVGRPLPNMDTKLVDGDGNDITAYDTQGELCVRGPIIVSGYYNNPAADQAFDSDGFYHTGDIAYCDGQTKLWYIVDRKKELIKVRAFQVAPPELEAVLLGHPQIVDAAVIGIPDGQAREDGGQLPRAYVVKRAGREGDHLMEEEVKRYLAGKLTKIKHLEGGVRFVDAIPRNASGKILKRVLREWAKKEMSAKL